MQRSEYDLALLDELGGRQEREMDSLMFCHVFKFFLNILSFITCFQEHITARLFILLYFVLLLCFSNISSSLFVSAIFCLSCVWFDFVCSLQILSLSNNSLTDEGIRKFTAPIRIKKVGPLCLQTLDLSGSMLGFTC